jgi:DNA-binding transcriptional regulator YiaG
MCETLFACDSLYNNTGDGEMRMRADLKEDLIALRTTTGMNRREFAEYFGIPYRTMQDWELGNRKMPEYLFRLMAYKVEMEKLTKKTKKS